MLDDHNPQLLTLLEAAGLSALDEDGWVSAGPNQAAGRCRWTVLQGKGPGATAVLHVDLALPDGRLVQDAHRAQDETPALAQEAAWEAFCETTAPALVAGVFGGGEGPEPRRIKLAGESFELFQAPWFCERDGEGDPPEAPAKLTDELLRQVRARPDLADDPHDLHWIQFFRTARGKKVLGVEARWDGVPWEGPARASAALRWERRPETCSWRGLWVLRRAEPRNPPGPPGGYRGVLEAVRALTEEFAEAPEAHPDDLLERLSIAGFDQGRAARALVFAPLAFSYLTFSTPRYQGLGLPAEFELLREPEGEGEVRPLLAEPSFLAAQEVGAELSRRDRKTFAAVLARCPLFATLKPLIDEGKSLSGLRLTRPKIFVPRPRSAQGAV